MAQEQKASEQDIKSLEQKLNSLNLTEGEANALAAMMGGELSQSSDVEPYIHTPFGSARIRTPWGSITSHRPTQPGRH